MKIQVCESLFSILGLRGQSRWALLNMLVCKTRASMSPFLFHSAHPTGWAESISGIGVCLSVCVCACPSSLQRWWISLLVGFTDPYNHTYSESLWWKLFKNHQKTQIQRQRQWQRQRQRQRHRKSAWNTHLMLYFWNPDDSLIPNMMIDTSPWSSCSHRSPWLLCSSLTFSSTGPSVSPFRDFFFSYGRHDIRNENIGSAFFKQWVYAMDIEFYILRHQDAVYDRVYISWWRTLSQIDTQKPIYGKKCLWEFGLAPSSPSCSSWTTSSSSSSWWSGRPARVW